MERGERLALNVIPLQADSITAEGDEIYVGTILSSELQFYVTIHWKELEPVLTRAGLHTPQERGGDNAGR